MNFEQITKWLEDNEIPVSGFYWAVKWNLNFNDVFKLDFSDIGPVKIIYEGFRDQSDRRLRKGNEGTLYLCIIFHFEKHNINIKVETVKDWQYDYNLRFEFDIWVCDAEEVKTFIKPVRHYVEVGMLNSTGGTLLKGNDG